MEYPGEDAKDLTPLNVIRIETALSRFPIHRIAKKGTVRIELKDQAKALFWKVSYNSDYGQPGPLAYKLDTLVVNRRIEEAGHPLPPLLRLGSLREIAEEVGAGAKNTTIVKNALLQNASTFINAKITFKTSDRSERALEAAFTRYSVIFTGETLPSGVTADAVYLMLNDPYREVLDAAVVRPLDYDYMRTLPPAAQRFYEIASYQIYGAILHQNERAKLRYSEYCLLSTAKRYLDFDHVKKQMHKIHKPHLDSGYLAKVGYELTTDSEGQPDWFMYYIPGPNAAREFAEFTGNVRKGRKGRLPSPEAKSQGSLVLAFPEPGTAPDKPLNSSPQKRWQRDAVQRGLDETSHLLVEQLVAVDLNRDIAERYAREYPEECQRQWELVRDLTNDDFEKGRGAYLNRAIPGHYGPPTKAYLAAQRRIAKLQQPHGKEAIDTTHQDVHKVRKEEIISQALAFLAEGQESGCEAILAALDSFEDYYRKERSRRVDTVTSPRLKEAVEEDWISEERRAFVFLTYFAEVYPQAYKRPCPIPELRDWLALTPSSEWKRLLG